MRPLRILLYAVNGLGMGHITRQLAIARYLRRYAILLGYQPEIAFLTTSEADNLPFVHGFAVFKIPSKTMVQRGAISGMRYRKLCKTMIWNCIAAFDPQLMVVDTFPAGSLEELHDVMDFGMQKVFVYRARKDQAKVWRLPILQAYNKILYMNEPHAPEDIPAQALELLGERICPIGAIVQRDKSELLPTSAACRHLGLNPNQPRACLLAGGGGDKDNEAFFERMIPLMQQLPKVQWVIGAGALYLGRQLPAQGVRWYYRSDISLYWNAFDWVVAAGGYNTVNELIHAQKPALLFAQDRKYDHQQGRIDALTAAGYCRSFSMEQTDADILQALQGIKDKRAQRALTRRLQSYHLRNHAGTAALEILALVEPETALERVEDIWAALPLADLLEQVADEQLICKVVRAFMLCQDNANAPFLSAPITDSSVYIENEDLITAISVCLQRIAAQGHKRGDVLPRLYQGVRDGLSLTDLLALV